jgi:hypothetical protein
MLRPPIPLQEVAGADDIITVHVPFFMTNFSLKLKRYLAPSLMNQSTILKNLNT